MKASGGYHHGDLRAAILTAADEILEQDGLRGLTLRKCARLAGVSHAAPSHHFGDLNGLLAAVAEQGFARLADALEAEIGQAKGDLEAEMQATTRAYVKFAENSPEHFRIMFRGDLINFDMSQPPKAVTKTFVELTNVILRQRGEAEVTTEDFHQTRSPELVNDIIIGWCYIHGFAHLKLEGQLGMIPDQLHDEQMALAATKLSHLIQQLS